MNFLKIQIKRKGEKTFILISTGFFMILSLIIKFSFVFFYGIFVLQMFIGDSQQYNEVENIGFSIMHYISWPTYLLGIDEKYFLQFKSNVVDMVGWGLVGLIASLIYVIYQRRK